MAKSPSDLSPSQEPQSPEQPPVQPPEPPLQEESPDSLLDSPPASPVVEGEPPASEPSAEEPPAIEPTEEAPTEVAEEPTGEESPPAPEPVEVPEYRTWDDVQASMESLGPEARTHVEAVVALAHTQVEEARTGFEEAKTSYDEGRATFLDLVTKLQENGVQDAAPLAAHVERQTALARDMSEENSVMAWDVFTRLHPEYEAKDGIPDETKNLFATMIEKNLWTTFDGKHLLDRLEQAYSFARFRTGLPSDVPAPAAAPSKSDSPVPPPDPDAAQQALVADDSAAYSAPRTSVDDLSMDEILARHDHYL